MVLSVPQNVEASSDCMIVDWAASTGVLKQATVTEDFAFHISYL
jgi:hypothetical protein